MNQILSRFTLLGLVALCVVGCSSFREEEPTSFAQSFIRLAPSAPPPKQIEYKPETTSPMMLAWRAGHWEYDGINFYWVAGEYIAKPDPTAVWSSDRWERRAFGWAFVPGHWR